jgi:hypothetical protein
LKTFLTQIGPTLPLMSDPPVICFWKWIGWKDYEVRISAKKRNVFLTHSATTRPHVPAIGPPATRPAPPTCTLPRRVHPPASPAPPLAIARRITARPPGNQWHDHSLAAAAHADGSLASVPASALASRCRTLVVRAQAGHAEETRAASSSSPSLVAMFLPIRPLPHHASALRLR